MSTAIEPVVTSRTNESGANEPRTSLRTLLRDYSELTKFRVTVLLVATAWCGYYFGALKAGLPTFSWGLFHALLGIGLVSSGAAALNEVMERDVDARMRRTARRPLPSGRMSVFHGTMAGSVMTLGGTLYLGLMLNVLTACLALATAVVYLAAYTPLKTVHPICTLVGAFPGAMPGVLGWTAARGHFDLGAFILFAIVFFWQFPHFFAIAWLYREDYKSGGILMLPVVEPDGQSTSRNILIYSLSLVPVTLMPTLLHLAGTIYFAGAILLGFGFFFFSARLATLRLPIESPISKQRARHLLRATVIYLPLLFALMMIDKVSS
ncbi:MAG TPA: heme o synthase [Terriglobales bacterium]|jgi:protoheme IX farnesyltransferase